MTIIQQSWQQNSTGKYAIAELGIITINIGIVGLRINIHRYPLIL